MDPLYDETECMLRTMKLWKMRNVMRFKGGHVDTPGLERYRKRAWNQYTSIDSQCQSLLHTIVGNYNYVEEIVVNYTWKSSLCRLSLVSAINECSGLPLDRGHCISFHEAIDTSSASIESSIF